MKRYAERLAKLEAQQQPNLQHLVASKLKCLFQGGDWTHLTLDSEVTLIGGDQRQYIAGLKHLAACGEARTRGEPAPHPGPDVIVRSVRDILAGGAES